MPRYKVHPNGVVTCLECGVTYTQLARHLYAAHQMSSQMYRDKHPGAPTISEGRRKIFSETQTKTWNKVWESEKFQKEQSDRGRQQMLKNHEDPDFDWHRVYRFRERCNDEEFRRELSRRASANITRLNQDPSFRERHALRAIAKLESFNLSKWCEYRGTRYRSKLEARWAEAFDLYDVQFEYEVTRFPYLGVDGFEHLYTPDFYIIDTDSFVEVKPFKFIDETVYAKLRGVWRAGFDIELLTEIDLQELQIEDSVIQ